MTKPWRLQRIAFFALIVIAAMLLLAACGDDDDDDDDTAATSDTGQVEATATPEDEGEATEEDADDAASTEEEATDEGTPTEEEMTDEATSEEEETGEATPTEEEEADEATPTEEEEDEASGNGSDVDAAGSITGAGASFPAPIYNLMFQTFASGGGPQVNYQSIGSGGGIEQYTAGTVDFGASDAPMDDEQMAAVDVPTLHIATVGGAVVPAYNLDGVDELNLTGTVLADIFLGNITSWDDPAIAELNPDAELPSEDINVVHRSDGSGTTNIFVNFLAAVSEQWAEEVGTGTEVAWPVGSGGQGNEGVTAQVQQTSNSIGYIELAYATENDIPHAALGESADGPFVQASLETASNGIGTAEIPDDLRVTISATAPSGADVYPIVGLTWLLVRQEMDDLAVCKAVAQAAWFATHEGQELAPELQYVPIAGGVVETDEAFIMSMTAEGSPCYDG